MQVENYYPELGHGQQEMSVRHAAGAARRRQPRAVPGDGARDRVPPRDVGEPGAQADRRPGGQRRSPARARCASLGPDGQPGQPVFYDAADRNRPVGRPGYHFIGGLLAHLPALVALTCASVNSYRRLAPQMWSSAYTVYGMDNREAAVRICSPMRDDPGSSVNLELKPSDSSANPYLAPRRAASTRAWTASAASSTRARR